MLRRPALLLRCALTALFLSPLLVQAGGAPARAASSAQSPTATLAAGERRELVGERTRTSRTYLTSEGYVTVAHAGSVHFRDAGGRWQPIDNTLVPASGGAGYENRANAYTATLPPDLSEPVRVASGGHWLSFAAVGARGLATAAGNSARYANALPGVSFAYEAGADALKETITLESPAAPASFRFALATSAGLTGGENAAGGADFRDAGGEVVFSFAPPFMVDAAGSVSRAVSLRLSAGAVTVAADRAWLASTERKWPVVIDPVVTFRRSSQECYILDTSPDSNYCWGGNYFDVGYTTNPNIKHRALMRFDVSSIARDAHVTSAKLGLYWDDSWAASFNLHALTRTSTSAVTWNKYDGTNAWTAPGGDYNAAVAATGSTGAAGWYHWWPTQTVQEWVDGSATNHGFLLKAPTETTANYGHFRSSMYTNFGPFLEVVWEARTGELRQYSFEDQPLGARSQLRVNVANGNLILRENDLNVAGTGLDLNVARYYNSRAVWDRDFGHSWNMSTGRDVCLLIIGPNAQSVNFTGPGFFWVRFERKADGSYTAPTGIDATLTRSDAWVFTLKFNKTGEKYVFNSSGLLTSHEDRNGNKITFAYDAQERLSSLTDTQGRVVSFTYNADSRITKMTDSATRNFQYGYNGVFLTSYTDPAGGITSYAYDANWDLTQITDPRGNLTKLAYDASHRVTSVKRVTDTVNDTGPTTTYAYPAVDTTKCPTSTTGMTTSTNPRGYVTTYCYDRELRVLRVLDARGKRRNNAYNANSDITTYTSAGNNATTNTYAPGTNNLEKSQLPTGAFVTFTYGDTVNPYSPTKYTDAQNQTFDYFYNAAGNVTKMESGPGTPRQSVRFEYTADGKGTVDYATDARGKVTDYSYDTNGNLTRIAYPAPLGAVSITYDGLSRVKTVTDGKGQTTTYNWDALDRLKDITYSDGSTIVYTYDANGNRASAALARPARPPTPTTS